MTIAPRETPNAPTAAPASLGEQMRYAQALAEAGLLPTSFQRQPANVLIALEIARTIGESAWTVMQEMAVIGGKPSFSAKFMRSRVRQAGHKLRESYTDGVARCVIVRRDDPDFEHVAEWDQAKAVQHGYWGKGHWAKNPELMLANRALSECVRAACYEVMGGVAYTPDELADFTPSAPPRHEPQPQRVVASQPPATETVDAEVVEQGPELRTEPQMRKLWALAKERGLADAEDFKAYIIEEIGRPLASTHDLTQAEASTLIDQLEALAGVDPTTGEVNSDGPMFPEAVEA